MRASFCVVFLTAAACGVDDLDLGETQQAGMQMQGMQMQGMQMQGMQMQGMQMQGFELANATLNSPLGNVRVEGGELVAERGATTLRGTALVGAHLFARASGPNGSAEVEYRITAITPESSAYDPTYSGHTYLYTLEQWVADTSSWSPACGADLDGQRVAIPVAATWNAHGDRVESSTMFTFGCTTGVIAKCYRWGYRPWLTGYAQDMREMHQTCTRAARADYCGDGISHTHDGTQINIWDRLPAPGPIQRHGLLTPVGMLFEAGWDTDGAVCLSRARWLLDDGALLAAACPDRLIPPGLLGATVCDTVADVLFQDPDAKIFNESYLNLGLGLGILGL